MQAFVIVQHYIQKKCTVDVFKRVLEGTNGRLNGV